MPKICREEDSLTTGHECTTTSTLDTPSQTTVFVEGKEVARIGDAVDAGVLTTGATTVNVE